MCSYMQRNRPPLHLTVLPFRRVLHDLVDGDWCWDISSCYPLQFLVHAIGSILADLYHAHFCISCHGIIFPNDISDQTEYLDGQNSK